MGAGITPLTGVAELAHNLIVSISHRHHIIERHRRLATTVDFWLPNVRLRRYVSGYHRYTLRASRAELGLEDVFFPAWANIRFSIDADPWSVRIGRRVFDPVPDCAFFGPTSHAGYVSAGAGTLIGIGLTPAGWTRLHGGDISLFADRVSALAPVFPWTDEAYEGIATDDDPAKLFDALLLHQLEQTNAESPAIERITARLLDPTIDKVEDLGVGLGLNARQIGRITRMSFGFTPKLLLRRARFLRALDKARSVDRGLWNEAIRQAGYWDGSHFLRDCHLFLDKTLGDFMAMDRPINRLSMQRRDEVLGAPMQSLYRIETKQ